MTLESIIRNRKGRAGSNGAWRVEAEIPADPFAGGRFTLYHYSTEMLVWRHTSRYGTEAIRMSHGHGSVSDQHGMNTAFKVLGLPYHYSRKGGATIEGWD